jgi:outer membrane protein OmpA-like peptidoglycan-associated protein
VNDNLDLSEQQEYTTITRDLFLVPIEVGSVVELKNIAFEYNKATLTTDSYPELKRVADMLTSSTTMTMEIAGHTDSKGGDEYNMRLSEARAQSVVDYLLAISKIAKSRLVAKGYGETKPRDTNDTAEGRANNRRVEIEILTK